MSVLLEPRSPISPHHPGLRLSTKVIEDPKLLDRNYSLADAAFDLWLGLRAYNGLEWVAGERLHTMLWPEDMPYSDYLFLHSARVLEYKDSRDPEYNTKYVHVLVNVPVGGDRRSETNERTCVCIDIRLDRTEFCSWGDHQMIWCHVFKHEIVRNVDTLVLSHQLKALLSIGTAQTLVQNIGRKALLSLGTAQTLVYNIGPVTLVVTHVLGHLPSKQERAPDADDARTMAAEDTQHSARTMPAEDTQHSAVIWTYWLGRLLRRYDSCDFSKTKVVETIMNDSVQLIKYTLSVHSVKGTPHLSRSPVEVDLHVLPSVKKICQEWPSVGWKEEPPVFALDRPCSPPTNFHDEGTGCVRASDC